VQGEKMYRKGESSLSEGMAVDLVFKNYKT
jgi:hypothetical protein